jgi:hypothetical protein
MIVGKHSSAVFRVSSRAARWKITGNARIVRIADFMFMIGDRFAERDPTGIGGAAERPSGG